MPNDGTETQQIIQSLDNERLLKRSERRRLKRRLTRMSELCAILLVNELKPALRKLSAIIKTINSSK